MQINPHGRQGWLRWLVFPFAAYLLIAPVVSFLVAVHGSSELNDVPTFIMHGSEAHLHYDLIIVGLAEYLTISNAFVCAIYLYRCSGEVTKPLPIVSILIIGSTALVSGVALFFPQILFAFWRSPALWTGEWWRLVTPLFVQSAGWSQYVYNVLAALFLLPLAEKFYGKRLLALYFVSGIIGGEVFLYALNPDSNGGGSSVAIYGVMGGLFIYGFRHRREFPRSMIGFVISGLCLSVFLGFRHDFHGTGILTGSLLACMMHPKQCSMPSKTPRFNTTPKRTFDGRQFLNVSCL